VEVLKAGIILIQLLRKWKFRKLESSYPAAEKVEVPKAGIILFNC
jgi:hypothetical protein